MLSTRCIVTFQSPIQILLGGSLRNPTDGMVLTSGMLNKKIVSYCVFELTSVVSVFLSLS